MSRVLHKDKAGNDGEAPLQLRSPSCHGDSQACKRPYGFPQVAARPTDTQLLLVASREEMVTPMAQVWKLRPTRGRRRSIPPFSLEDPGAARRTETLPAPAADAGMETLATR